MWVLNPVTDVLRKERMRGFDAQRCREEHMETDQQVEEGNGLSPRGLVEGMACPLSLVFLASKER